MIIFPSYLNVKCFITHENFFSGIIEDLPFKGEIYLDQEPDERIKNTFIISAGRAN